MSWVKLWCLIHTVGGDAAGRGRCGGWHQDKTAAGTTWRPAVGFDPGCLHENQPGCSYLSSISETHRASFKGAVHVIKA